jgi:hypothetical protein
MKSKYGALVEWMITTRENQSNWWQTCPNDILSTINTKLLALWSKMGLRCEKPTDMLYKLIGHYQIHKNMLQFPVLNYLNWIHTIAFCLYKIYFIISCNLRLRVTPSSATFSLIFTPKLMYFRFLPNVLHARPNISIRYVISKIKLIYKESNPTDSLYTYKQLHVWANQVAILGLYTHKY